MKKDFSQFKLLHIIMHYKKLSINLPITCLIIGLTTINTLNIVHSKAQAAPTKTQTQIKAKDWYIQGLIKLNEQDYSQAIKFFNQAIKLNPQYAQAYYQRGLIYAKYIQGKISTSNGLPPGCKRIEEINIVCEFTVTADWRERTQQKAIKDFTQAIQINPQYAAAYHHRGLLQEKDKSQDFEKARKLYWKKFPEYLNQKNYESAASTLASIEQLNAKRKNLNTLQLVLNQLPENPVGSSTESPNRKKSPEELTNEARLALRKGDLKTAYKKYKQVARVLRKNEPKYREVQQIIAEIERNGI